IAIVRYWNEVLCDQFMNHFCEAVSDPAVAACCTTRGEMEHYIEVMKKIMKQDDIKRVNERLAEINNMLGEQKAVYVRQQVLKSMPVVRWFLLPVGTKTPEEISALLTVYREEKLKDEQTSRRRYVRCIDLERAMKTPYEACVKAQAARA